MEELLLAAEYILDAGNPNVILCERGIRTFENHTRFTLPLASVVYLHAKTHLPVVVDPSHGTGHTYLVPQMALCERGRGRGWSDSRSASRPGECDERRVSVAEHRSVRRDHAFVPQGSPGLGTSDVACRPASLVECYRRTLPGAPAAPGRPGARPMSMSAPWGGA